MKECSVYVFLSKHVSSLEKMSGSLGLDMLLFKTVIPRSQESKQVLSSVWKNEISEEINNH